MMHEIQKQNATYFAFNSDITFYASKSYSRQPLKNSFEIQSYINNHDIQISLFKKHFKLDSGVIPMNARPRIEFTGELLEFDYSELSENESTVIIKGDMRVLCDKKQKTFIGSIKKIKDTVILKANILLDSSDFEFEKVLTCDTSFQNVKTISVEMLLELKA